MQGHLPIVPSSAFFFLSNGRTSKQLPFIYYYSIFFSPEPDYLQYARAPTSEERSCAQTCVPHLRVQPKKKVALVDEDVPRSVRGTQGRKKAQ